MIQRRSARENPNKVKLPIVAIPLTRYVNPDRYYVRWLPVFILPAGLNNVRVSRFIPSLRAKKTLAVSMS